MIAMSSFGGVAPQLALEWLAKIKGNQYNCVIVAIYGNRAYENTLVLMEDYAVIASFQVIATISAVAAMAKKRLTQSEKNVNCSYKSEVVELLWIESRNTYRDHFLSVIDE